jgi:hypothetical protein
MIQTIIKAVSTDIRVPRDRKISIAAAALVLFILVNSILGISLSTVRRVESIEKIDLTASILEINVVGKVLSWWIAKWYYSSPKPPDIIVLGSSELGSIQNADGHAFNEVIDLADHPRSLLLERFLHEIIGGDRQVILASLPGMMISDQLIVSSALFSEERKPALVALIFTPRDFLDNVFGQPRRSEAFAFFSRYTDLSPYEEIFRPEIRCDATYFFSFVPLRVMSKSWRQPFNSVCNERTFCKSL